MSAEIHVRWVDVGKWSVRLPTKSHLVGLGSVEITRSGSFSAFGPKGVDVGELSTLMEAARKLYAEEFGKTSVQFAVRLPFSDGSGP